MTGDSHDDDAPARTRELLTRIRGMRGSPCRACATTLCGHAAVMSVVLGYQHQPRCARCLAGELREPLAELCERTLQWVQRRDCFLRGWLWASAVEGFPEEPRPACLSFPPQAPGAAPISLAAAGPAGAALEADADWDGGDMGCGDLVLELRLQLRELGPGAVLRVRATDPGAPVDLPAWCGLTGHTLLRAQHPHYWILRRDD